MQYKAGVGVGVFVCKDGKFIMGQRKGDHGAGSWSVPGGWLEFGENFQEAAIREVKEETGMDIENVRFAAVSNNVFLDDNVHSVTIWMLSDWKTGEPTITEPDKFVDQKWADFDSLPSPLFLAWDELLNSQFLPTIKAELEVS